MHRGTNRSLGIESGSVASLKTCFCLVLKAASIVFKSKSLFQLFVLSFLARAASQSYYTLRELLHHPLKASLGKTISLYIYPAV